MFYLAIAPSEILAKLSLQHPSCGHYRHNRKCNQSFVFHAPGTLQYSFYLVQHTLQLSLIYFRTRFLFKYKALYFQFLDNFCVDISYECVDIYLN